MILAIFLVGLLAVSAVSADEDDAIGAETDVELTSQNITDDVLSADEQSFTQLNATVNGNDDDTVYLNNDYKYSTEDSDFKRGIVINRNVAVYGNGHTIDGNGEARIFNITGGNVTFYNIKFINGQEYHGGAIYGECEAINCTFENNAATCGGAMFKGSARDCTFSQNSAIYFGGAIEYGSAVNCYFIGNSAEQGGAMFDGSARDCTFSQNSATLFGGAMYSSSAVKCTFSENTAGSNGGAMEGGCARDCSFSQNQAGKLGGAMEGGSAVYCTFTVNAAGSNGGAIYGGSAVNCVFIGNSASNGGGAMYEGYHLGSFAGALNDFYNTKDLFLQWGVNDLNFTYNSADPVPININNQAHTPIMLIDVGVSIYKNGSLIKTYHCLSGDWLSFDYAAGNYVAELVVTYPGLNQPDSKNITLTINKITPKIEATASNVVYPNKVIVNVKADIDGMYHVKIGSTSKSVVLKKGVAEKVAFTGLTPKKYTAAVSFSGNENYTATPVKIGVTVKKATPKLTAKSKTFKKSVKTKKYSITLKTNKKKPIKNVKVIIKINKKTYTAKTNKKGVATFKITKLTKKGTFKSTVTYKGNKYYNKVTKKVKIRIK